MRNVLSWWLLLAACALPAASEAQPSPDEQVCARVFAWARRSGLAARPIGEITALVARRFLGAPYEAGTLDRDSTEHPVTNLRTFDCVTLVENVVALARCIRREEYTFGAYARELETVRYRGGACSGYASRLHYFSDWIADGEAKGIVRDITRGLGGRRVTARVDFITTHRARYPRLGSDTLVQAAEHRLSRTPHYLLAPDSAERVPEGAIVAIASSVPGLDIAHTGIAVRGGDGRIHLLHAPDVGDSVRIAAQPLARYAARRAAGMMIAAPVDPRR